MQKLKSVGSVEAVSIKVAGQGGKHDRLCVPRVDGTRETFHGG